MRLGRIFMAFALAMALAMHSPTTCRAAHPSCHHSSGTDAPPLRCCQTVTCVSIDTRHFAAAPAPSLANTLAPAAVAYLAPRQPLIKIAFVSARAPSPPARIQLVIELRTLLI
jgi:hypothetical protein